MQNYTSFEISNWEKSSLALAILQKEKQAGKNYIKAPKQVHKKRCHIGV